MSSASEHNRKAWDKLVRDEQRFTRPAPDSDFQDPLAAVDGCGWLGPSIAGRRVLCLASGIVTVVDVSSEMLALDRQVAAERGLDVRTVQASMDDLSALASAAFDI